MAIETVTTLDFSVLFTPIFKFIIVLFAVVGAYSIIKDLIHAISRGFKDKLDHKKDCQVIEQLSKKKLKVIAIENAHEIQELNEKYVKIEEEVKFLMGKINGK